MANESIQVFWEYLGNAPGTTTAAYHETLLYTNSSGHHGAGSSAVEHAVA